MLRKNATIADWKTIAILKRAILIRADKGALKSDVKQNI